MNEADTKYELYVLFFIIVLLSILNCHWYFIIVKCIVLQQLNNTDQMELYTILIHKKITILNQKSFYITDKSTNQKKRFQSARNQTANKIKHKCQILILKTTLWYFFDLYAVFCYFSQCIRNCIQMFVILHQTDTKTYTSRGGDLEFKKQKHLLP